MVILCSLPVVASLRSQLLFLCLQITGQFHTSLDVQFPNFFVKFSNMVRPKS